MRNIYILDYNNKDKCKMFVCLQEMYVRAYFIRDRCTQIYRTCAERDLYVSN